MLNEQGDVASLTAALDRFSNKADQILLQGNRNSAKSEVNAGGAAVWIATTACLVMLALLVAGGLVGGLWLSREFGRIDIQLSERKEENDRAQTYLSSIFGRVPELRKQIDSEKDREKKDAER